ncbi:MAG: PKD domain-containing protein [Bacteroidota bacterium]
MSRIFNLRNVNVNQNFLKRFPGIYIYKIIICSLILFFSSKGFAQSKGWSASPETQKVFIENQGQFPVRKSGDAVLFAYDNGKTAIYFTKKGIIYSFIKPIPKKEDDDEREKKITFIEEYKKKEAEERITKVERDVIYMNWVNPNPNVELIASDLTTDYYSYCVKEKDDNYRNINYVKAYKKIVYKNIYPNIDIEYVFHPSDGLKYSLILHPGADISLFKMNYSVAPKLKSNGDVHIKTKFGDIIDHAPSTFYSDNKSNTIASYFVKNDNTISFNVSSYSNTKTVIIDPWTQTPALPNSNGVWECEQDAAGNVYIIGGDMPMKLIKYNAAGTLQWTYVTPWDTANNWLGTLATDMAGNSYVTSGSIAALQKITPAGGVVYTANSPIGSSNEYWSISFNCDQTKLVIGGTGGTLFTIQGAIFNVNAATGAITNTKIVGSGNLFAIPPAIQEVRSFTSCQNSRYYYLTLDTIGAVEDNFVVCPGAPPAVFAMNDTYHLAYKCENYRPDNGNSGIKALRANRNFLYSQNGTTLHKRSLVDASIIASVTIPGGISVTTLGQHQVGNSGLDIDSCGNVYVGSGNCVLKYDANLNLLQTFPTTYKVFDVSVGPGGNVVFCGATGTNATANRIGTVQSTNMAACAPMTLLCCDANVCPAGPLCNTDNPITLVPNTPGGTWSGLGVDPITGVFSPGVAGAGTIAITYTLACGTTTINIVVNPCGCPTLTVTPDNIVNVCTGQTDGSFNASTAGGAAPYTYTLLNGATVVATFPNVTGSQAFTGLGAGTYTLNVMDANNCPGTVTVTISTIPNLTPTITGNLAICAGATTTLDAGTGYANYAWSTTETTQTIDVSAGGTYSVTVTNGTCTGNTSVTVTQSAPVTPIITGPTAICTGTTATLDAGAGYAAYAWSTTETTQTINISAGGTYSVTVADANNCTGTTSITVTQNSSLMPTITGPTTFCPGNSVTLDAGSGYAAYAWSTNVTTQTISVNTPGTYTVTVSDALGCSGSASVTVSLNANINFTVSSTNASCTAGGSATANISGAGYTYIWSTLPPQYTQTATGLPVGTYTVTVSNNGCTGTAVVNIINDVGPQAGFYAQPQYIMIYDGPIIFFDQSTGNITNWSWDFGDGTHGTGSQIGHEYSDTGNFLVTLVVTDVNGCTDTAISYVYIYPYFSFWIPNSFTPNGDTKNEIFKPQGVGIDTRNYYFAIFDRWGAIQFVTTDLETGWNGTYKNLYDNTKCVQGVYVYLIKVYDLMGNEHTYRGHVTLYQ